MTCFLSGLPSSFLLIPQQTMGCKKLDIYGKLSWFFAKSGSFSYILWIGRLKDYGKNLSELWESFSSPCSSQKYWTGWFFCCALYQK